MRRPEQAVGVGRAGAGTGSANERGLLAILAAAFRRGETPASQLLGELAHALGVARLEWWPSAPGATPVGSHGRPREREVDRPWIERLPHGTMREIACAEPDSGLRRPRLAPGRPGEAWVRASLGTEPSGWLRLVAERRPAHRPAELVGLADLFAAYSSLPGSRAAAGVGRSTHAWSAVVHDLRNELTFAQLALERAALEGSPPTGEVLQTLARAREISTGALRGAEAPAAPRAVALHELMHREARAAAASERGPGNVAVRLRCAQDLAVAADPATLGRVVRNLLLNAVEASRAGEFVALSAERIGPRVRLLLEDHGHGMSGQEVGELFRPGATGGAGTGWGTTSVREGITSMGGTLAVESGPGEGTCVEVWLWAAPTTDRLCVVQVDHDAERAARRAAELEAQGLGTWVVRGTTEARQLVAAEPNIRSVEIPAGGSPVGGPGGSTGSWRDLRAECRTRGLAFEVRSWAHRVQAQVSPTS